MEELKQLARALMDKRSYKDRNDLLGEMLDYLSFEFSECYSLLVREIRKREFRNNAPHLITKWIRNSTEKSFIKLNESLLLVRPNNFIAKEFHTANVKCMLNDMIEQSINVDAALKICNTIRDSTHLRDVYESTKCNIQTVYQIHQYGTNKIEALIKTLWDGYNNDFKQLSIQYGQQQNIAVAFDPNTYSLQFNINQFSSGGFNASLASNWHTSLCDRTQIFPEQTTLDQSLVEPIMLWLTSKKLHKYKWFFMELSFNEIEGIREDNIEYFISKVNKNSITKGAQKKICYETKFLRDIKPKCEKLILTLDLEVSQIDLFKHITFVQDILVCPIPNNDCINGGQIQQTIMLIMKKLLYELLDKLTEYFFYSSLEKSINRYIKCTSMILKNSAFTNDQVEETIIFAELLKNKLQKQVPSYVQNRPIH
eukprot:XP_016659841.1 PREDICTED: uncharacterized protein LOC107883736 [Acyrthosiphon pisum]